MLELASNGLAPACTSSTGASTSSYITKVFQLASFKREPLSFVAWPLASLHIFGASSYICTSSYIIKVFQLARPSHLAHILMTILQNLKLTVSHTYSLDGPGVILPCKDANIVNRKNWSWLASDKTGGISLS